MRSMRCPYGKLESYRIHFHLNTVTLALHDWSRWQRSLDTVGGPMQTPFTPSVVVLRGWRNGGSSSVMLAALRYKYCNKYGAFGARPEGIIFKTVFAACRACRTLTGLAHVFFLQSSYFPFRKIPKNLRNISKYKVNYMRRRNHTV